jgi:hypothetical protein
MPGKLIMTWDINPEHEQEYFEFVVREFLPQVQKLGFQLNDAWVTVYGNQPRSWFQPSCQPSTKSTR